MKDKSSLTDEAIPQLAEIVGDEDKAKDIVEAAKASFGRNSQTSILIDHDCDLLEVYQMKFL